jgi:hypothetical protein
MRATIEALGGEYRFQSRVDDLDIAPDGARRIRGVVLRAANISADHVVLAVGHSARDTFRMLYDRGVSIEAKPFSIGFRIEHPQSLIDRARFGKFAGNRTSAPPTTSWCIIARTAARLQLLHVSRRHGGGGHVGRRPRGDQRHEPIFAQRAQRQCRDRRRHHACGLSGSRSCRDRSSKSARETCLCGGWRNLRGPGAARRRFSRPACFDIARCRRSLLQAGSHSHRFVRLPSRLCDCGDPRSAARVRPPDPGVRNG